MGNIFKAARTDELDSGQAKLVEIEGKEIALLNCDGTYYAIDNEYYIASNISKDKTDSSIMINNSHD